MEKVENSFEFTRAEEFCLGGRTLAIFGTGSVAEMIYHAVDNLGLPFGFFIVNDGHRKESHFMGYEVYELSEVKERAHDVHVIYGISDRSKEIAQAAGEAFNERFLFEDYRVVLYVLLDRFFKRYFSDKGIDMGNETMEIGRCRIINPFQRDFNLKLEWLTAMCDVILPPMLSEYSYVNEGPYELGPVYLQEGDVVFDCGANAGAFSAVAASKGCKVYAFEPIPQVIRQLDEVVKLYGDKVEIAQYALGNKTGKETFYMDKEFSAVCTMREELCGRNSGGGQIQVDITTVDDFVEKMRLENVDFIKADIEGAERFMLEGAAKTLTRMQPKLAIATYHLEGDKEELESIIRRINPRYKITHKWKMLYAYVPE